MSLEIKSLVAVVLYAITINLFFGLLSSEENFCSSLPDMNQTYLITNSTEGESYKDIGTNIVDVMFNRCEGLPAWIFWLFQAPLIVALAYIGLEFIPFLK